MTRVLVTALKRWSGTLDGKAIDSAKAFIQVKLDSSRNDSNAFASGICTEEVKLPSGEFVKRLEHIPLPFEAEMQTERVSNGKVARDMVTDIRPITDQVVPQPVAKRVA